MAQTRWWLVRVPQSLEVRGVGGPPTGSLYSIPPPACPAGRSHVMQRVLSTVQFLWVLGQALVDGLTDWLHTFTRHHRAMSDVLRAERYLYTQALVEVSVQPTPRVPRDPPPIGNLLP